MLAAGIRRQQAIAHIDKRRVALEADGELRRSYLHVEVLGTTARRRLNVHVDILLQREEMKDHQQQAVCGYGIIIYM